MKDADKDGVADRKDKCANTPAGAFVDKVGCIIDKDKDGIADNLDACPDNSGIAQFNGCPDTDRDGIQDSKDKCIDIAGIAKFDGCPDTDNDGIKDSEDKCPSVYGVSQFSGCPDTDNDGIQDSEDACPNEKGTAQFNGCPDSDGDGIADNKDKCPTVAGPSSNNGCPEIKAEVRKLFERALQGVQFESGRSTIKKESFAILNNVITVMIENPSYKLYIAGHTDNAGNADKNLQLSKARAAAVEKYLENKGVSTERVRSEGFGSTVSVADNATKEGRSKNRRVEFKVEFEDVVK
jgi:outer membrane protein OmpA-like peptidoglycan-associated protein